MPLLEKYLEKSYRSYIDLVFKHICQTDFPYQYQDLEAFCHNFFKVVSTQLGTEELLSSLNLSIMKTIKIIVVKRAPKKIGDPKGMFYEKYLPLIEAIHPVWEYCHQNLRDVIKNADSAPIQTIESFFKFSRDTDRILIGLLYNGCREMAEE